MCIQGFAWPIHFRSSTTKCLSERQKKLHRCGGNSSCVRKRSHPMAYRIDHFPAKSLRSTFLNRASNFCKRKLELGRFEKNRRHLQFRETKSCPQSSRLSYEWIKNSPLSPGEWAVNLLTLGDRRLTQLISAGLKPTGIPPYAPFTIVRSLRKDKEFIRVRDIPEGRRFHGNFT